MNVVAEPIEPEVKAERTPGCRDRRAGGAGFRQSWCRGVGRRAWAP